MKLPDMPKRLPRVEETYSRYVIGVAPDVPRAVLVGTNFWSHVNRTLRVGDVVEIHAHDNSFFTEIRLITKTPSSLKWQVLRDITYDFAVPKATAELDDKLEVEWVNKHAQYRIVDKGSPTKNVLVSGLSRDEAERRLEQIRAER